MMTLIGMWKQSMWVKQQLIYCNVFVDVQTLKYLGDVHVALKNKALASKFYNRALRILRKRLGSIDQTVKQLEQYVKQLNLND